MRTREGNKDSAILEAAVKVFAEKGFHNAKIHTIAEQAGVATGSVYVYFKNKEAILLTIFESLWEKLYFQLKNIVCRNDISALDKFDSLIDLLFDSFIENPSLAIVFVNEQNQLQQRMPGKFFHYYDGFMDLGEGIVSEGIKNSLFNPNIDVKIIRSFIFGGLRNLLHQWAQNPHTLSLNGIRQNVKYFAKRGLLK